MATTRDYTNSLLDAKIVLRNDTAANWKIANPILLEGEFAVELDTKKFKLGDGTTPWNSLKYLDFGSGDLGSRVETLESEMTEAQGNIYVLSTQMAEALKAAADAAEAKKLAEETSEKVDGFDQRITDAETKAEEASSSVAQYDQRIQEATDQATSAYNTASQTADGLQELRTTVNSQETRIVALENKGYDGGDVEL